MKTIIILLSLWLTNSLVFGQQALKQVDNAERVILGFLRDVYATRTDAVKIAHQYIKLRNEANDFSVDKRYEVAAAHVTLLRQGSGLATASAPLSQQELAELRIENYNSVAANADAHLLPFVLNDDQRQHLYIVLRKGAVWKYFYLEGDKILSFDYLRKGANDSSFLFSY